MAISPDLGQCDAYAAPSLPGGRCRTCGVMAHAHGTVAARQCPSVHPGLSTLPGGRPIRCQLPTGHAERHGHSYAARYWD